MGSSMKKLYYGIEDKEDEIPGNVLENGELIYSILIPSEDLSEMEKPGCIEIEDEEDEILKNAREINPSEYLVKRWKDGKAKRIHSGLIGGLEEDWKEVSKLEVYGDGKIYADDEKIEGEFTITQASTVLIKDVQGITEETDQDLEKEYFNCIHCDKEVKSYKAIENSVPDDWTINPNDKKRQDSLERKDDGTIVLKGVCPDCEEKD
uniref:Uncharacterized protein n=1 Tax=uncultured organism TaxID=155900 RepID=M1PV75_9ZZZZ|nr:hypothetical protein FLSS-7_0023 [uncultured organism]